MRVATTVDTATMAIMGTTAGTMLALITRNNRACSKKKASLVKLEGLFGY